MYRLKVTSTEKQFIREWANTKKTFRDVDKSGIVTLVGACAKQIAVRILHESSSSLDTSPSSVHMDQWNVL